MASWRVKGPFGIGALVEGNPGNVKKVEPSVTTGYRLGWWREDRGPKRFVTDRAREMRQREFKRCVCVLRQAGLMCPALTLPYTICHSPHYRDGIGMEHQRSSLRVTLHRLFQHCCSASPPLSTPPAFPTFIFHIWMRSMYLTLTCRTVWVHLQNKVSIVLLPPLIYSVPFSCDGLYFFGLLSFSHVPAT